MVSSSIIVLNTLTLFIVIASVICAVRKCLWQFTRPTREKTTYSREHEGESSLERVQTKQFAGGEAQSVPVDVLPADNLHRFLVVHCHLFSNYRWAWGQCEQSCRLHAILGTASSSSSFLWISISFSSSSWCPTSAKRTTLLISALLASAKHTKSSSTGSPVESSSLGFLINNRRNSLKMGVAVSRTQRISSSLRTAPGGNTAKAVRGRFGLRSKSLCDLLLASRNFLISLSLWWSLHSERSHILSFGILKTVYIRVFLWNWNKDVVHPRNIANYYFSSIPVEANWKQGTIQGNVQSEDQNETPDNQNNNEDGRLTHKTSQAPLGKMCKFACFLFDGRSDPDPIEYKTRMTSHLRKRYS